MSRIVILAPGTRGDVQPFIALGVRLQTRGHEVIIGAFVEFEDFVTSHGLGFRPLEANMHEMLSTPIGQQILHTGANPVVFLSGLRKLAMPILKRFLTACEAVCEGADLIVWSFFGVAAVDIGEKLGKPTLAAFLQPFSRTSTFASVGLPYKLPNIGAINYSTHVAVEWSLWYLFGTTWQWWRMSRLKLPPMLSGGMITRMVQNKQPIMYAFSETVVPRPPDWGEHLHITGYWFLDHGAEGLPYQPSADLMKFLKAGPPPVYIGFGSMVASDPEATAELVVDALRKAGQRGLLMTGWGGLGKGNIGHEDIFVLEAAPHDWLLPKMAAAVHHGGAGTTAASLRAGIPNIIVPHFADQPFWARRIEELGAGPTAILRSKLNTDNLAQAIEQVMSDASMRQRATEIGMQIRAEDGTGRAVKIIERMLGV